MNFIEPIKQTLLNLAYQWLAKGMPDIYGMKSLPQYLGQRSLTMTRKEQLANFRSWVYACINARAKEIQAAEFQVMQRTKQNEFKEVSLNHPLVKILNDPNEYFTKKEILYVTVTHLDLTGDCFWYTPLNGLGVPSEIWILPVERVKIIPSKGDEFVSHYEVSTGMGAAPLKFGKEEIVHLRYPNPCDPYYGMSVLQAGAYAADINTYQHEYQREFYRNFAVPDFALKTEAKLDKDTRKRLARDWQENYSGTKNKSKIAILEAGLDVARLGVNPKELNWLADNRFTMQELSAIFGVPPSKIAQEDVPNRSVAETSDYSFSKNTIEPILGMIDERLTQDLAQEFDESLVIKHKSTIRGDEERTARVDQIRISSGQITINESRRAQGLEDVEGGDEILVPTSVQKLSNLEVETV